MTLSKFAMGARLLVLSVAGPLAAQTPAKPDPTHIPFVLPQDIKWHASANVGEDQAPLFGDPSKPGPYGLLIRWNPNHNSSPHSHSTDRFAYVLEGPWWVSSAATEDKSTMYPIPAGSYVEDIANTVHWDGAHDKPVTLIMFGDGPVITKPVAQK